MNKAIKLFMVLGLVLLATSSCKTKQKIAEIPGANAEATKSVVVTQPTVSENTVSDNTYSSDSGAEVTRNENFNLAEGELNSGALKYKYHVVVGSFSKQTNARGLQNTLNTEGNSAIVVVNENGMFRVLIASYNQYVEARAKINEIKTRFPDAWVLVKK